MSCTWACCGTSLLNGAALCPRHHTIVHERNLTTTITSPTVTRPT